MSSDSLRNPKSYSWLKQALDHLVARYSSAYLSSDPLWFPHQYQNPLDQELVAFLSSACAYGSVPQILKLLRQILKELGDSPVDWICRYQPQKYPRLFEGIYYRFHQAKDFRMLIYLLSRIYLKEGSLGASFQKHFSPHDSNIGPALASWTEEVLASDLKPFYSSGKLPPRSCVRFFFSSPNEGSACKRLNLFLRWMVRGPDGIDLGLWKFIDPSKLIIPLDTHIYRVAQSLNLTQRKSPNWRMAEEITEYLKRLDPNDPIRYDFALTRLGILDLCPPQELGIVCRKCQKTGRCLFLT